MIRTARTTCVVCAAIPLVVVSLACMTVPQAARASEPGDTSESAQELLRATGVKGGLIVHLGCGDGQLTAALRANDSCVVHGLDPDAKNVEAAREQSPFCDYRFHFEVPGS